MKVMLISASPNKDGLTEACCRQAKLGVEESNGEAVMVRLNDLKISNCRVCGNGWGTCRNGHQCSGIKDDFQELHRLTGEMDAFVVVTPVYWGEMSEPAKAFFDRYRRCEALKEKNKIEGKPVISIAAAGGSGNGTNTCLASMERLFSHVRAVKFDMIGITRKNRNFMLEAIRKSAAEMVASLDKTNKA